MRPSPRSRNLKNRKDKITQKWTLLTDECAKRGPYIHVEDVLGRNQHSDRVGFPHEGYTSFWIWCCPGYADDGAATRPDALRYVSLHLSAVGWADRADRLFHICTANDRRTLKGSQADEKWENKRQGNQAKSYQKTLTHCKRLWKAIKKRLAMDSPSFRSTTTTSHSLDSLNNPIQHISTRITSFSCTFDTLAVQQDEMQY